MAGDSLGEEFKARESGEVLVGCSKLGGTSPTDGFRNQSNQPPRMWLFAFPDSLFSTESCSWKIHPVNVPGTVKGNLPQGEGIGCD